MSADRTVAVGEWGHSKIRCNGHTDGRRCNEMVVSAFRAGIKDARERAALSGWRVSIRTRYAPNGYELRDYCPRHVAALVP